MGFPWGFSGGSLLKRFCKSLLKKKLGDLILGDIDLDQLDVQLTKGMLNLSDLSLNTEFINHKLSGSMVMLKEGSIRSLTIRIPLKLSCEIIVEDLELVLSPFVATKTTHVQPELSISTKDGQNNMELQCIQDDQATIHGISPTTSRDVDEGVKKIANVVKWFLASFNIKIRNFYVVLDPDTCLNDMKLPLNRSLVFRIKETEFGTRLTDDTLLKLNNFIKFKEAEIEFLMMNDVNVMVSSDPATSVPGDLSEQSTTAFLKGPFGGFSGLLNLSIPWKNGSLNLERIDAELSIDSLELRLQPNIVHWAVNIWDSLQNNTMGQQNCTLGSRDFSASPAKIYTSSCPQCSGDVITTVAEKKEVTEKNSSTSTQDEFQDYFLKTTYVIQNYLPEPIGHEDQTDLDLDEASIDQFFECFEELRTSQMILGNSGIWNWTCSVFNAITYASTLASGSEQVPKEQLIEKRFHSSISEISVVLFFSNEEHNIISNSSFCSSMDARTNDSYASCFSSMNFEQSSMELNKHDLAIHHLQASCREINIDLETYPEKFKLKMSVGNAMVDEYYYRKCPSSEFDFVSKDPYDNPLLSNYLRSEILAALPPFSHTSVSMPNSSVQGTAGTTYCCSHHPNGLIKVGLLECFDIFECQYEVSTSQADGHVTTTTSVSVIVPPVILWLHFHTLYMLLQFLNLVNSSIKTDDVDKMKSNVSCEECGNTCTHKVENRTEASKAVSQTGILTVQVILSPARVVVCFPDEFSGHFGQPSLLSTFIVFNHTVSLNDKRTSFDASMKRCFESYPGQPFSSICMAFENLDISFLQSAKNDVVIAAAGRKAFSVMKIFSATSKSTGSHSTIAMIWQNSCVTSPLMAEKAWSLVALKESEVIKRENFEGVEFSSAGVSEKLQENGSNIRRELILNSKFLLHGRISFVSVHLSKNECMLLIELLTNALNDLSGFASSHANSNDDHFIHRNHDVLQSSVYFELDVLDICTDLNDVVEVNHLMQTEIEGHWSCLKLHVEKFECLSVSNVGGISNFGFLWMSHEEGELWGSMTSTRDDPSEVDNDFLLIVCRNSACGRGDGNGKNLLSIGSAGTSVTHMQNPQLFQSYLSIDISGSTIVAPGGRYDWINAIVLLFNPGPAEPSLVNDEMISSQEDGGTYKMHFFLELLDVALSYESCIKNQLLNDRAPDTQPNFVAEDSYKLHVGCLLASSSLRIFSHDESSIGNSRYCIQLRDLGFLIRQVQASENVTCGYHVGYLQRSGFVKIAQNTMLEAYFLVDGNFWKLEILNSQFNIDICHDTTNGLVCLSSQLQQLYAPDVQDVLSHLQSRWSSLHKIKEQSSTNMPPLNESSSLRNSEECGSGGLLDEVLENAFHMDEDRQVFEGSRMGNLASIDSYEIINGPQFGPSRPQGHKAVVSDNAYGKPLNSSEGNESLDSLSSHIIDTYYVSDLPAASSPKDVLPTEGKYCKVDCNFYEDVESGWYNDESLTILEDHVSDTSGSYHEHQLNEDAESSVCSRSDLADTKLKGIILLHEIDVRCRMHAGNDWPIATKDSADNSTVQGRDSRSCLEFYVSGIDVKCLMYPDGEVRISKLSISAQEFNLFDISRKAPWKMVLGCYRPKDYPRDSRSKAFVIDLELIRPEPLIPVEDIRLQLEILPLRLHLDQGQLNFLISFFQNDAKIDTSGVVNEVESSGKEHASIGSERIMEEALLPYFQKFDVRPLVIRVDYIPRQFDPVALGKGKYAELLNILPWKGIELKLKHVSAVGVYGLNNIFEIVAGEWLEDISQNQVHKLLKGLPPIKTLYSVSSGTSKLVSLPVKSFKKDGKLIKGMQRGAAAFMRSVSLEAIGLGVHLAAGAHELLHGAECILRTQPPPRSLSEPKRRPNIRSNQPENTKQGLKQAYESITDGFGKSASALVGNPIRVYRRGDGPGPALASAICGAPGAAVAPISASARAFHYALVGLRNSLDPEHRRESAVKYSGPSHS